MEDNDVFLDLKVLNFDILLILKCSIHFCRETTQENKTCIPKSWVRPSIRFLSTLSIEGNNNSSVEIEMKRNKNEFKLIMETTKKGGTLYIL